MATAATLKGDSAMNHIAVPSDDIIVSLPPNLEIRRVRKTDRDSLAPGLNNPKVWRNMLDGIPQPYTLADADNWYAHVESTLVPSGAYDDGTRTSSGQAIPCHYAIVVNGKACGGIGLIFGEAVYRRTATLGYWLAEEHWGKGYMGRLVKAFVEWTWETWGILGRLDSFHFRRNVGSGRVLEKAGFEYEGLRKKSGFKLGKWEDEGMYGLLRPGLEDQCD